MYSRNRDLCRSKKQREGRSSGGTDPLSVQTGLHLHEATVVEQREVFENLLDMLLVRTRADQQGIRRINHDIVVQRIHHDDLLSGRLDQAVRRIVEFRVGRHDIAIGVLGREFVKRAPGSDVVPAEIRTPHENIIGTFQHAVVDRDDGQRAKISSTEFGSSSVANLSACPAKRPYISGRQRSSAARMLCADLTKMPAFHR